MNSSWKAFLGVLLVFFLGVLAGALIAAVHFKHRATVFFQRGTPAYVELLEHHLTRGLALDDTQRQEIHEAFLQNIEERKKLQAQIQPQVQELNMGTMREIRSVLRPDQLATFRDNLAEFRQRTGRPALNTRAMDQPSPEGVAGPPVTNAAPGQ
jgi:hypothetical protein